MKTYIFVVLLGIFSSICHAQDSGEITEKRNAFNKKGDYFFEKKDYNKALVYYTMAYQNDNTDYFSILKRAETYAKMRLYPQAEECYSLLFDSKIKVNNSYRLKYALALLESGKTEEFKACINTYMEIVNEEIESENYLVSSESKIQMYKDTAVVLGSDSVKFKIRYEGYKYQRRTSEDQGDIHLLLSNGNEYNISSDTKNDFRFAFQPMEDFKLVIQKENILADDIISSKNMVKEERKKLFLSPPPLQKAEIALEKGMKYDFTSGSETVSPQYLNSLKSLADEYQEAGESSIDLTAVVKEMEFKEGEVYTIRFVKADQGADNYKKMEISNVTFGDQVVNIYGQSFFIVLPQSKESNFMLQTNIEELKKQFNPKKHGLKIDEGPVFETRSADGMLSLSVNTDDLERVPPDKRLTADELSIIPGTEYVLSLSKPDPVSGENVEIFVPLTKGIRYNLTADGESVAGYKTALVKFLSGRAGIQFADEEIIDIHVLSKVLEVSAGEDVSFTLKPVMLPGQKTITDKSIKSTLTVDEKVFEISVDDTYIITVPFASGQFVNFQTDLGFLQDNFADNSYMIMLDTVSFDAEIRIDTTGYGAKQETGWLSMSVNTEVASEVGEDHKFVASEVSIIPGNEYILTVTKVDAETREKDEIFIPLLRDVKYDFTSKPSAEDEYQKSLDEFLAGRENIRTTEGTLIDITILSKELQIAEDDEVSFSLLPVKKLPKMPPVEANAKSSLFLDNKIVEFTYIHKYTINIPLSDAGNVNMQTNLQYLGNNFDPGSISIDLDTMSFFSEMTIDTTGLGDRIQPEEITDPVFDVVTIYFNVNEHILQPEAKKIIQDKIIGELMLNPKLYVTIKGFTDGLGDEDYNLRLSRKRAASVQDYIKGYGIRSKHIRTFSFGETQILKEGIKWEDLSPQELSKHRKVEIVIYLPE